MKGDFSRFSFRNDNNYIGVLKQQGRITLDSDWNEQADLWRENFRLLTRNLLGSFAIPLSSNKIAKDNSKTLKVSNYRELSSGRFDFEIGRGFLYVDGYPLGFQRNFNFLGQADYPEPEIMPENGDILVFIESWLKTYN